MTAPFADSTDPDLDQGRLWLYGSPHDLFVWHNTREASDRLAELAAEVGERVPTCETLMADLFLAFYRADVHWAAEPASPDVAFHRQVLDRVLASPSYHRLHPEITGNLEDSLAVLDVFTRAFAASLDPDLVEFLDAEAAFWEHKNSLAAEAELIEQLIDGKVRPRRRAGEHGPESLSASERKTRLAELATEIEALEHRHKTDYRLVRARAELRRHLDKTDVAGQLGDITGALEDFRRALSVWGDDASSEERLSIDERLSLFRRLVAEPRLREATDLLGRSRFRASVAHRSKTSAAPRQLAGVMLGNDISRLVPSELAWLAEPGLQVEFGRRYAEHELAVFRLDGSDEPRRGPLVVCLDESSSMEGERDMTAKAIGLAMIGIARTDGRDAALVEFAAQGSLRISHFAAGDTSLTTVVDALAHFFGGGTDFDVPLAAAVDLARRDRRYADADVIMITDGEGRLHEDTRRLLLEARAEQGIRLFAVCVGVDDTTFRDVAEKTWSDIDLAGQREELIDGLIAATHPSKATERES